MHSKFCNKWGRGVIESCLHLAIPRCVVKSARMSLVYRACTVPYLSNHFCYIVHNVKGSEYQEVFSRSPL